MSDTPLDATAIRHYLAEVGRELGLEGPAHTLVLVGGSLLAIHGLRETTADVDSIQRLRDELRSAVAAVAVRHDLTPGWVNDRAAMFAPATFDAAECEVLIDEPRLKVLGAPLAQVFLMKLLASRAPDFDDLVIMWPRTGFASAEEAAEAFHAAYPHLDEDPYLADHIRGIARLAGGERD